MNLHFFLPPRPLLWVESQALRDLCGQSCKNPLLCLVVQYNKLLNKIGKVRVKEDLWEGQSSLADLINYCILKCLFTEVSSYKRSDVN